eukprot:gene8845-biopygen13599
MTSASAYCPLESPERYMERSKALSDIPGASQSEAAESAVGTCADAPRIGNTPALDGGLRTSSAMLRVGNTLPDSGECQVPPAMCTAPCPRSRVHGGGVPTERRFPQPRRADCLCETLWLRRRAGRGPGGGGGAVPPPPPFRGNGATAIKAPALGPGSWALRFPPLL